MLWNIVTHGRIEKQVEPELIKLIVVCYMTDNRDKFEPNKNVKYRAELFYEDSSSQLTASKQSIDKLDIFNEEPSSPTKKQSLDRIGLLVDVIIFYLQNIDGKKYLKGSNPSSRKVTCKIQFVNANIPEKKITLPENSTLNHLRNTIAEQQRFFKYNIYMVYRETKVVGNL